MSKSWFLYLNENDLYTADYAVMVDYWFDKQGVGHAQVPFLGKTFSSHEPHTTEAWFAAEAALKNVLGDYGNRRLWTVAFEKESRSILKNFPASDLILDMEGYIKRYHDQAAQLAA